MDINNGRKEKYEERNDGTIFIYNFSSFSLKTELIN